MSKKITCLSIAVSVLLSCTDLLAASKNEEVIRRPSLLMLDDILQVVGLGYSYQGHASNGTSSSSHGFTESYSLQTTGAIYDADLVSFQLDAGILYRQDVNTRESSGLSLRYNLAGQLFPASYHPMAVSATRSTNVVSDGYNPSYTISRETYQLRGSLQNSLVPLTYSYSHGTSEVSRSSGNSSSKMDIFGVGIHHALKDITATELFLSAESDSSEGQTGSSYSTVFTNQLFFDSKKKYILQSAFNFDDSKSGGLPQRNVMFTEVLMARVGEALTGSLNDQYSFSSTAGTEGNMQEVSSNSISGSLSHRLYRSLTTTISAAHSDVWALGGKQTSYNWGLGLGYSKLLPAQSSLSLSTNVSRSVTDQNFNNSDFSVVDEQHLVGSLGGKIPLFFTGRLTQVFSVSSLVPVSTTFVEGVDYRVDFATGQLEILVGGSIQPGTTIFVTYQGQVNRQLRYQTDRVGANAMLSVKNGHYTVSADYTQSNESKLSGSADEQGLVSSRSYALRAAVSNPNSNYGAEALRTESTQESVTGLGAFWDWTTHIADADTLHLMLRDNYTLYDTTANSSSYQVNTVTGAGNYSYFLNTWLRFLLGVSFSASRSSTASSAEVLSFRAGIDGSLQQLTYSLRGQSFYRFSGSQVIRDDSLQFNIVRYF